MVSHVESAEGVAELSEYVGRSINVETGSNDTAGNSTFYGYDCVYLAKKSNSAFVQDVRERGHFLKIVDIFLDFRAYIIEVFGSDPDEATLDWNSVGACIHYLGEDRTIQLRLWERSEGHLGIPDMTLIIIRISFRGTHDVIYAEMTA